MWVVLPVQSLHRVHALVRKPRKLLLFFLFAFHRLKRFGKIWYTLLIASDNAMVGDCQSRLQQKIMRTTSFFMSELSIELIRGDFGLGNSCRSKKKKTYI